MIIVSIALLFLEKNPKINRSLVSTAALSCFLFTYNLPFPFTTGPFCLPGLLGGYGNLDESS